MALDVGAKTIGVAVSGAGNLALGVATLRRGSLRNDCAALRAMARERGAALVLVGWPRHGASEDTPALNRTRKFMDALRETLAADGVEVRPWDERYSTVEAEEALREAGVPPARKKAAVDAAAAAVILQSWLDAMSAASAGGGTPS